MILQATHIAGKLNVLVDQLSKIIPDHTEWSLKPQIFKMITRIWGTPHVDLFVTYRNHKLHLYVSPFRDTHAWKTDTMSLDWADLDFYTYPQTSLLG